MEQLFFAGKAYLKINSLVKTPLHEFMAVERSGLLAPDSVHYCNTLVSFSFRFFVVWLVCHTLLSHAAFFAVSFAFF